MYNGGEDAETQNKYTNRGNCIDEFQDNTEEIMIEIYMILLH